MRYIRVLSLLCGLSCLGVGLANEQQCLAMHTFQTTYNRIVWLPATCTRTILRTDFEDGVHMCNSTQNTDDQYNWLLDNALPDHTLGSKLGHSLRSQRVSYVMCVTSRPFNPAQSYCIRFFYKAESNQNTAGKFSIYLQEGNKRGYPVFTVTNTGIPAHDWTLAEITPDPEYLRRPFQIVFEADHLNQYVYVLRPECL